MLKLDGDAAVPQETTQILAVGRLGSGRMTSFEKRVALMARIDTLERHAGTLEAMLTGDELKTQTGELLATLQHARAALEDAPTTSVLEEVEHSIDAASLILASLGR